MNFAMPTKIQETDNFVKQKTEYTVLKGSLGGGPHGLGDPEDKSLRKVEKDVVIAKIVRDRARIEKCIPEVAAFNECCVKNKYSMVYKCRPENTAMQDCYLRWYNDQSFWDECTQMYLEERSEYRRTGITKKQKARDQKNKTDQ